MKSGNILHVNRDFILTNLTKLNLYTADIRSQIERIRYEANEFKYNNGKHLKSDVFEYIGVVKTYFMYLPPKLSFQYL